MNLASLIRTIPDYPKPGILFRDITTLLKDSAGFNATVNALAVDPVTATTLYAGTPIGIYRSLNGGTLWLPLSATLLGVDVRAIAFDPATPNIMYAATDSGVY